MKRICCQVITLAFALVSPVRGESIAACYGDQFPGTLCRWPTYIQVQSAYFGITSAANPSSCDLNDKLCAQNVSEVNPEYYQQIQEACNDKRSCDSSLIADWAILPECGNTLSHYVEIIYFCLRVVTTTTLTTTTSNSTEGGGDPGVGGGLSGGAIAGIVFGVVLVLALTVIIVLLVFKCRKDPQFASQTKTTVMKPFNMIKGDKKTTRTDSASSGPPDTPPDILRHAHINGHHTKLNIKHQNISMNRDSSRRSGIGPEIILTPQQAGANPPNAVNIQAIHAPVPSIEIVSTPQEAIRRTGNNLPFSPKMAAADEENVYEEFDDDVYDEFDDQYDEEEYAEISDFERTDNTSVKRKKKPSLKPKPKLNKNQLQTAPKPKEQTLTDEIMSHLKRRKDLVNNNAKDKARSSTLKMTENDDLYYNSGEVDTGYDIAVDGRNIGNDGDGSRYYDLQPKKKQMSRKYEQLHRDNNSTGVGDSQAANKTSQSAGERKPRQSQGMYSDDGEYYDDYDDWSTEDSGDDYLEAEGVRTSAVAIEDGHGNDYSRRISSTQC